MTDRRLQANGKRKIIPPKVCTEPCPIEKGNEAHRWQMERFYSLAP